MQCSGCKCSDEVEHPAAEEVSVAAEKQAEETVSDEEEKPREPYPYLVQQERQFEKAKKQELIPGKMETSISDEEMALGPQPLSLEVAATSVYEEFDHIGLHVPERLIDGDIQTAWCEGREREKNYESITVTMEDAVFARDFDQLRITPGWQKTLNTFVRYARAKKYILTWIGRDGQAVSMQEVPMTKKTDPVLVSPELPKGVPVAGVRLNFEGHYETGWIPFLCVSEMEFLINGKPAQRTTEEENQRQNRLKWLEFLDKNAPANGYRYVMAQNKWLRGDGCQSEGQRHMELGQFRYYNNPGDLEEYVPVKIYWEKPFVVLSLGEEDRKEIASCRYTFCPPPACKTSPVTVKDGKVACLFCGGYNVESREKDRLWYAFE